MLNKSWISYLVIFLLMINIAALGTIIYYVSGPRTMPQPVIEPKNDMRGRDIVKSLNLSKQQDQKFRESRDNFKKSTHPIIMEIQAKKEEIVRNLDTDNPDTAKLNKLADELGDINGRLKKQAIRHFIELRKECRPEQRVQLRALCRNLFMIDERGERGMRHRHGRGGEVRDEMRMRNDVATDSLKTKYVKEK